MKTSELIGPALDFAVAECEGTYTPSVDADIDGTKRINYGGMYPEWSTDWSQGGPIIERERIQLARVGDVWEAWVDADGVFCQGSTPLIAAMRAFVASKLGDEIEVPEEVAA